MKYFLFLIIIFSGILFSQNKDVVVNINYNYTTSAKIYLNPTSSDPFLRNSFFQLGEFYNPAFEIRYRLTESLLAGFNIEFLRHYASGRNLTVISNFATESIPIEEGFRLIPIELALYYQFPFSLENLKFYFGGGVGFYFGDHIRQVGNLETRTVERKFSYGINASIFLEYFPLTDFALTAGMKFRDPQFQVKNYYENQDFEFQNRGFRTAQESFDSKINIDGLIFNFGVAYHFDF